MSTTETSNTTNYDTLTLEHLTGVVGKKWTSYPEMIGAFIAEMDFGSWEGVPWDEVSRAGLDAWAADLLGFRGHGGESVGDLAARVESGLRDLGGEDLVVCHLGVIRAVIGDI